MSEDGSSRPDLESSSRGYARRFSGSVGRWMLDVQADAVFDMLAPWPGASVLDIGGGHGQLAPRLRQAGYDVKVLGSGTGAFEALDMQPNGAAVPRIVGDLESPPLADGAVDVALAFRMMPHIDDWTRMLAGMRRVARRAVVVDFPVTSGFNALGESLFTLKKWVEGDTRRFRRFDREEVLATLATLGLGHARIHAQYLFPMALHRLLRIVPLCRALEGLGRASGLTSRYGSPLILRASFEEVG